MVPPDAFSTAAPQSSSAFCSGCDAGTQCDSFSSKVFSCANAGVTLAASSNANKVFLIDIVSPHDIMGFDRPLQILLYDIIIIASSCGASPRAARLKPIIIRGASLADKSSNHCRRARGLVAGATASRFRDRQRCPGTADPHPA